MSKKNIILIFFLFITSLVAQESGVDHGAGNNQLNFGENDKKLSGNKTKYIFMSLILPGSGQWFMGNRTMAKIFMGTEVALWAGYFGTQAYVDVLEKDFHGFAAQHAGVNTRNKRVERNLDATYRETEEFFWQWDSQDNRYKYNDIRFKRHDWKRRLTFMVSGLVLNRLVSAIDVIRLIRKQKNEKTRLSKFYFDFRNNRREGDVFRLNLNLSW